MVYLIHITEPIGDTDNPHGSAQHYVGWAIDVHERLRHHRACRGAKMLEHCVKQGISFQIHRVWLGDRTLERRIKDRHDAPRLCPVCNPHWTQYANYAPNWMWGKPQKEAF